MFPGRRDSWIEFSQPATGETSQTTYGSKATKDATTGEEDCAAGCQQSSNAYCFVRNEYN
ncbi:MAG: hypothetical protein ACREXY_17165 [Gammaproteobacteria bacterium]